jgi:hypothetical protein
MNAMFLLSRSPVRKRNVWRRGAGSELSSSKRYCVSGSTPIVNRGSSRSNRWPPAAARAGAVVPVRTDAGTAGAATAARSNVRRPREG